MSTKSASHYYSHDSDVIWLLPLGEAEIAKTLLELTQAKYDAEEVAKKTGRLST